VCVSCLNSRPVWSPVNLKISAIFSQEAAIGYLMDQRSSNPHTRSTSHPLLPIVAEHWPLDYRSPARRTEFLVIFQRLRVSVLNELLRVTASKLWKTPSHALIFVRLSLFWRTQGKLQVATPVLRLRHVHRIKQELPHRYITINSGSRHSKISCKVSLR
jgi:hypothetical protein